MPHVSYVAAQHQCACTFTQHETVSVRPNMTTGEMLDEPGSSLGMMVLPEPPTSGEQAKTLFHRHKVYDMDSTILTQSLVLN